MFIFSGWVSVCIFKVYLCLYFQGGFLFVFSGWVCRRLRDGGDSSHGGSYVLGGLALLPVRFTVLQSHLSTHRYVA